VVLSVHQTVVLSVHQKVVLSVHQAVVLSVHQAVVLSVHQAVVLSVHQAVVAALIPLQSKRGIDLFNKCASTTGSSLYSLFETAGDQTTRLEGQQYIMTREKRQCLNARMGSGYLVG
jgi:hypothetical protein